ncbi:hypothetical protein [Streptomyces sp. AC495_CC817]|uniref:hypothetical protein n=1 Tax=Streptomyces sp. AC495_CC817 TaxID=2823900 RepID=UPI001C2804AA|nr:hypothetical protein [Streptomyces sp. AC495_CC817]
MPTGQFVQEASKLALKRSADGTYPVVLITEGEGSSGRYGEHLFAEGASEHVFENVGSYADHPIDPRKPHLRSVLTLAGRMTNVHVGEDAGKRALLADFKPRKEYEAFVEEFGDLVGLSIFCGADGELLDDGRLDVSEFDAEDPYRSVDIVVAAGRGGRFKRAEESLRAIESSLGKPGGTKPAAEASAEEREGEHMDEKEKAFVAAVAAAVAESIKPVIDFVNESATKKAEESQAQVDAEAVDAAVMEALDSYEGKIAAIDAAELLPPQVESLKARARKGEDITEAITEAKAVVEAAREIGGGEPRGHTIGEASRSNSDQITDWSF